MSLLPDSVVVPEQHHNWKGNDYTVPATGTLRVFKSDMPRDLNAAYALIELHRMLDELYETEADE